MKYKDKDYVDEDDNVIGQGQLFDAYKTGAITRVTRAFLINSKNEVLLQKRGPDIMAPNKWDQSVGGHVDAGETYIDAAARELEEELSVQGVELKEVAYFKSQEGDNQPGLVTTYFNKLFTAHYDGEFTLNEEVSEVQWVPVTEVGQFIDEHDVTNGLVRSWAEFEKAQE